MKNILFLLLFLLGFSWHAEAIPLQTIYSPKLGVSPTIWQFKTQDDLRHLIVRSINNPRACYYIMNVAYTRHMEVEAAYVFRELQHKDGANPQLQIIYTYALFVAGGPASRIYFSHDPRHMALVNEYGIGLSWLKNALKAKPNSAELQLMGNLPLTDDLAGSRKDTPAAWNAWSDVLARSRQVIKMAPQWADAHFWYGQTLFVYYDSLQTNKKEKGHEYLLTSAEKSLLEAESLDSGTTADDYRLLYFVSSEQGQKRKALSYLKGWMSLRPEVAKDPYWIKRRAELVRLLAAT